MKRVFSGVVQFALAALLLSSCTSVPLSSLVKMANLDKDDIAAIDPKAVRVKLSLTEPAELYTRNVQLALKFDHFDKTQSEYKYQLQVVDIATKNDGDLFGRWFNSEKKPSRQNVYTFKLAPFSILEFNRYQKEFAMQGKPKRYYWTVYYYLKPRQNSSKLIKDIQIDMELKLSDDVEYFYLLKGANVSVE